jgi:hypothetical protein
MSSDGGESWSNEAWYMGAIQFLLPKDQYTFYAGGDGGLFEISTRPDWTVTSVAFDSSLARVGTSFNVSHDAPVGTAIDAWTIDAVRLSGPNDHTGSFVPVSATITVSP